MVPALILFVVTTFWAFTSPHGVVRKEPRLFFLVTGVVFSNLTVRSTFRSSSCTTHACDAVCSAFVSWFSGTQFASSLSVLISAPPKDILVCLTVVISVFRLCYVENCPEIYWCVGPLDTCHPKTKVSRGPGMKCTAGPKLPRESPARVCSQLRFRGLESDSWGTKSSHQNPSPCEEKFGTENRETPEMLVFLAGAVVHQCVCLFVVPIDRELHEPNSMSSLQLAPHTSHRYRCWNSHVEPGRHRTLPSLCIHHVRLSCASSLWNLCGE